MSWWGWLALILVGGYLIWDVWSLRTGVIHLVKVVDAENITLKERLDYVERRLEVLDRAALLR